MSLLLHRPDSLPGSLKVLLIFKGKTLRQNCECSSFNVNTVFFGCRSIVILSLISLVLYFIGEAKYKQNLKNYSLAILIFCIPYILVLLSNIDSNIKSTSKYDSSNFGVCIVFVLLILTSYYSISAIFRLMRDRNNLLT